MFVILFFYVCVIYVYKNYKYENVFINIFFYIIMLLLEIYNDFFIIL